MLIIHKEEGMKVYRCNKGCTVGDTSDRCPRCGDWKYKTDEKSEKEVEEFNEYLSKRGV